MIFQVSSYATLVRAYMLQDIYIHTYTYAHAYTFMIIQVSPDSPFVRAYVEYIDDEESNAIHIHIHMHIHS